MASRRPSETAVDLSKYRHLYVSETQENLEKMAQLVVALEASPGDREAIDTVFRLAHSIKGMSGTMGYQPMFDLAHQLEDLVDRFRRDRQPMTSVAADVLLAAVDHMTRWVADVEAERLPLVVDDEASALLVRVQTLVRQMAGGSTGPVPPVRRAAAATGPVPLVAGPGETLVGVRIDEGCPDPGVRGFLVYRKLTDLGQIRASHPDLDTLRSGRLEGPLHIVLKTRVPGEQIEAFLRFIPDVARVEAKPFASPPPPPPRLAPTGDADLVAALLDEPEPGPRGQITEDDFAPGDDEAEPEEPAQHADAAAIVRAPKTGRTIRVRTDWLDTILDRTSDLLIVSQRLWSLNQERLDPAMTQGLSELSRVLSALHGEALSVRMMPLSVLTERLPRVVRDLARQSGKSASLVVHGDDQQLDRAIIEGLDSPLTHMLRNAVEHGVEPMEERASRGKRATGLLTLTCTRVRDEIVVELSDDGRGMDRRRLVDRAVELGLLSRARAEALADRDLTRLVCLPGLTIRSEASALGGRGVGLDAVHEAVTALGGRVEVVSELGAGTTIRLRLPRTPGISKLLLVEADGQVFGLPLSRVSNTAMFSSDAVTRENGMTSVVHRNQRTRLVSLRGLLGLELREAVGNFPGVVFNGDEGPIILAVDRVVGQQDAVVKPLGPLLERIDGLLGVTIDPAGQPVFVVDVARFLVV
jgi:two-component system chemotaxis sensor kinase CheA